MNQIKLTRSEKEVFRLIAQGEGHCPSEYPQHQFNASVQSLVCLGLVYAIYEEGHNVVEAILTSKGKVYLASNPKLINPIDWRWLISTAIGGIAAIAATIALFLSYSH